MAKKSLSEMLSENTGRADALETARRQAAFLAVWEEINECYAQGWSYIEIWRALSREGVVDFSYSTFLHLIRKMKRRRLEAERAKDPAKQNAASIKPHVSPAAPPIAPGTTRVDVPRFGEGLPPRDPKKF